MSNKALYIKCTGSEYLDTCFIPNGNTTIEIDCMVDNSCANNQPMFGSRNKSTGTDTTSFTIWGISSSKIRIDHYGATQTLDSTYTPKTRHKYKITPTAAYVDDVNVCTFSQSSNSSSYNLIISGVNTGGSITYGKYIIYSCKIWDNGTLIRNYEPYVDDSGVYCFKNLVDNSFVYSATSTSFKGLAPIDTKHLKPGDVIDFDYTGAAQSITLPQGTYKLECWGAQGGYAGSSSKHPSWDLGRGGYGGYSVGTITLSEKKTLIYIYTGGAGQSSGGGKAEGGWPNGGSSWASSTGEGAGGGGGSSDIRIGQDSLYARVIVAGGGGGGGEDSETGGYGGGTSGGNSGSGTAGGATSPSGYFGIGGHTSYDGGGGGGGWYGACPAGGSTTPATSNSGSDTSGSPGGSGYVYTSSTASQYPSGCLLNSSYYLSDAQTINGGTSFTSPSGSSETGHPGNGHVRITVIDCKGTATICAKINSTIKQAKSICFKMNNKIYGFGSSASGGTVMNFDYTGSVQTATLTPGTYKLECWGAQGGTSYGGKGGYSVGTITLTENNTILYIYSGGQGDNGFLKEAFNGGGAGYGSGASTSDSNTNNRGGGGGGSDIRIAKDDIYARVIVAGGGGGGFMWNSS